MKPTTPSARIAEGRRIADEMMKGGALVDLVEHEAREQPDHLISKGMLDAVADERLGEEEPPPIRDYADD